MSNENEQDYLTFSYEKSKEDYMLIKKYAVENGKRMNNSFPRIYEFEFVCPEGFCYTLMCAFEDRYLTIRSIHDLKQEIENKDLPSHSYSFKDIGESMENDECAFEILLDLLRQNTRKQNKGILWF